MRRRLRHFHGQRTMVEAGAESVYWAGVALGRQALGLLGLAAASFVALAPAVTPVHGESLGLAVDRPHNLKLLINGKRLAITRLNATTDNYVPIRARSLRVEARWTTNARGTGYRVQISTTEPQARDYASCSTGTSCLVGITVPILVGQEMSWSVKILKTRTNKLLSGFKVCLVGHA
jgi:hypothetical protein